MLQDKLILQVIHMDCTDKNALNYNPNANKDDGSCIAKVFGCTDSMGHKL